MTEIKTVGVAGCAQKEEAPAADGKPERVRVGLVAKSLGNGFFDAVHKGAQEAAAQLDADVIFEDGDWLQQAAWKLDQVPVCQLFSSVHHDSAFVGRDQRTCETVGKRSAASDFDAETD